MIKDMFIKNTVAAFRGIFSLSWITGPIFDKELRISSRRKRNYILRMVYLLILLVILVLIWAETVSTRSFNVVYQVSRLSWAGIMITSFIITVQFYLVQVISVVMLSNSISDEVSSKTLGVLMSTPISSLQVVTGKLLSKLLQIILLLCLTLPILGIVRVFGGIPWDFLLASFCVTLTAVIFTGILTLNISIHVKHAYISIIRTILILVFLYVVIPLFSTWITIECFIINENVVFKWIMVTNPLFMMYMLMVEMFSPRSFPFSTNIWNWHCLFMLTCFVLLFLRAVIVVRKKALLQACGQLDYSGKRKRFLRKNTGKIRRITGPPLLWKELRSTTLKSGIIMKSLFFVLIVGSILASYFIFSKESFLDEEECHVMYGMIFSILSIFFTATFSATAITSEKTNQTWPVLLSTLVTDRQIIIAKMIGILRRSAPFWSILFLHVIIFTGTCIHPAALPHVIIIIIPLVFFVTSSGIFFSSLYKHTTSAVVTNLIFVGCLWGVIPLLASMIDSIMRTGDELSELVIMLNPFYHLGQVLDTTGRIYKHGLREDLEYYWEIGGSMSFFETTIMLTVIGFLYSSVALGFLWIAKKRLRKKIV